MTEKEEQAVMAVLVDGYYVGYAYVHPKDGGKPKEYLFDMEPEKIASFIVMFQDEADKIVLTDMLDRLRVETKGGSIVNCSQREPFDRVRRILEEMQSGERKTVRFPMVTRELHRQYCRLEDMRVKMAEYGMEM